MPVRRLLLLLLEGRERDQDMKKSKSSIQDYVAQDLADAIMGRLGPDINDKHGLNKQKSHDLDTGERYGSGAEQSHGFITGDKHGPDYKTDHGRVIVTSHHARPRSHRRLA